MKRPVDDVCPSCRPKVDPIEDACVCPPLGEPELLTIVAPAVFDECGINLCKVTRIPDCVLAKYPTLAAIDLEVVDIDFGITCEDGSEVEFIPRRPNCIRVKLSNICVKFAVKLLDCHCKILKTLCFSTDYLPPDAEDPDFNDDTNPTSITVDLYAPYGVSYLDCCCDECLPTINFLGLIEDLECRNNSLRQGVNVQALAKIIELNLDEGLAAIGLTLYLKTVYFVQYKIKHCGLCVPPKCIAIEEEVDNACLDFVKGDLLEKSIQPLEVCKRPKSFKDSSKVVDPTPAVAVLDEEEEDCHHKKHCHKCF
jgi:hypothetical protein